MPNDCDSDDSNALLHHDIIHLLNSIRYGIVPQSLVQQIGRIAAEIGQPAIVSETIELGLKIDGLIILAALRSCSFETFKVLWTKGFDVANVGWWLDCAMLHAISAGDYQMVEFCLDEGADLNPSIRFNGHEPLALAAVKGSERILKLLLQTGAEVEGSGAFEAAAEHGHTSIIKALISNQLQAQMKRRHNTEQSHPTKIDGNQRKILPDKLLRCDMTNAIVLATEAGHEVVVNWLLMYGVDPARKDVKGRSALQVAELKGHARLVTKLEMWIPKY